MTAKIIPLGNITRLDLDPDQILENAKGKMECCIILGHNKDGEEYFASSIADGGTVAWWLDRAKYRLMKIGDDYDD